MRRLLQVLGVVVALAYPLLVYLGLTRFGVRELAWVGVPLLVVLAASRVQRWEAEAIRRAVELPLLAAGLLVVAALLREQRVVFATPVAINALLLAYFAASLRGTPFVERMARLQDPELSEAKVRYCRRVTLAWCVFFAVNGAVCALLAAFAPLELWALYTGLVAYLLIGAMGAGEYLVRKWRFRDYGGGRLDGLIARAFPPLAPEGAAKEASAR